MNMLNKESAYQKPAMELKNPKKTLPELYESLLFNLHTI